jgi:Flp pilus assembly protein TadG
MNRITLAIITVLLLALLCLSFAAGIFYQAKRTGTNMVASAPLATNQDTIASKLATRIKSGIVSVSAQGTVASMTGNSITIEKAPATLTVGISPDVQVFRSDAKNAALVAASISDISVNDTLSIVVLIDAKGNLTASWIDITSSLSSSTSASPTAATQ